MASILYTVSTCFNCARHTEQGRNNNILWQPPKIFLTPAVADTDDQDPFNNTMSMTWLSYAGMYTSLLVSLMNHLPLLDGLHTMIYCIPVYSTQQGANLKSSTDVFFCNTCNSRGHSRTLGDAGCGRLFGTRGVYSSQMVTCFLFVSLMLLWNDGSGCRNIRAS